MWLEVIHLRVIEQGLDRLIPIFLELVEEIREKEDCRKVKLLRRALIDTDVCLHLYHDSQNPQATGSPIGLRLAAALKPFGMVNHTVWLTSEPASSW